MVFPFEKVPHKVYKSSSLQSVFVTFWYDSLPDEAYNDAFYKRMEDFTLNKFALPVERRFPTNALQIWNNKNQTRLVFARDRVYALIDCDGYVSFDDSAFPQAYHLKDFLKDVIGINELKAMSIRKINIWRVGLEEGEQLNEDKIRQQIFSKEFLACNDKEEMSEQEKKMLKEKFKWSDKEQTVWLRTAFLSVGETQRRYNMVMDSEAVSEQVRGIRLDDMATVLRSLNNTLFDAFNWAVNPEIIIQMEKGLYTL